MVVIENQFGPTDHTHLGQIMTYLAGQDGRTTVIWIAETIREEHRAAIDWLNASTIEGFNFFAVEVEALRIGNSTRLRTEDLGDALPQHSCARPHRADQKRVEGSHRSR